MLLWRAAFGVRRLAAAWGWHCGWWYSLTHALSLSFLYMCDCMIDQMLVEYIVGGEDAGLTKPQAELLNTLQSVYQRRADTVEEHWPVGLFRDSTERVLDEVAGSKGAPCLKALLHPDPSKRCTIADAMKRTLFFGGHSTQAVSVAEQRVRDKETGRVLQAITAVHTDVIDRVDQTGSSVRQQVQSMDARVSHKLDDAQVSAGLQMRALEQKVDKTGSSVLQHMQAMDDKLDTLQKSLDRQTTLLLQKDVEWCPRLFMLVNDSNSKWNPKNWGYKHFKLHVLCEATVLLPPGVVSSSSGGGAQPCCVNHDGFPVKELKPFMKKALPVLRVVLPVLQAAVKAGRLLGLPLPSCSDAASDVQPDLVAEYETSGLDVMEQLVDTGNLVAGTVLDEDNLDAADRAVQALEEEEDGGSASVEKNKVLKAAYREMHQVVKSLVTKADPDAVTSAKDSGHLGGLIKAKYTPPGGSSADTRIMWVCPHHVTLPGMVALDGSATVAAGAGGVAAPAPAAGAGSSVP